MQDKDLEYIKEGCRGNFMVGVHTLYVLGADSPLANDEDQIAYQHSSLAIIGVGVSIHSPFSAMVPWDPLSNDTISVIYTKSIKRKNIHSILLREGIQ